MITFKQKTLCHVENIYIHVAKISFSILSQSFSQSEEETERGCSLIINSLFCAVVRFSTELVSFLFKPSVY